jgi:SAM-dependent methyltransferase
MSGTPAAERVEAHKRRAVEVHSTQADAFAGRYRTGREEAYASCFAYSRLRLDAWLEKSLPSTGHGLRALDVGCGPGHHLGRLNARGFEVAGVDGSPEMLAHARAGNPGVELRQADVESLPFPDASFDLVLCLEVLRYLPDPHRCLSEIARVLRPGGRCLATALPLLNLNGFWFVNRLAGLLRVPGLVRLRQSFTTSWALRRAFREAGFGESEVHGVYLGPVNWIERLSPSRLPRALGAWERIDERIADRRGLRELSNMFFVDALLQPYR